MAHPPAAMVNESIGVRIGGAARAYPLPRLGLGDRDSAPRMRPLDGARRRGERLAGACDDAGSPAYGGGPIEAGDGGATPDACGGEGQGIVAVMIRNPARRRQPTTRTPASTSPRGCTARKGGCRGTSPG
jgi:hypothetical protein